MERSSGILLHITSLPSPHGIGTLGASAREFVDFLAAAGQSCWQLLPLTPTGMYCSPYQCFSTFAGNTDIIDLNMLADDGLLTPAEINSVNWGKSAVSVDFDAVRAGRDRLLRLAYSRFDDRASVDMFRGKTHWLPDYSLYTALKTAFNGASWCGWPDDIRRRSPAAMAYYRSELRDEMDFCCFTQYEFFRQFSLLREYAKQAGIKLIGDIPIYVPTDSADVWAFPQFFALDADLREKYIAGVPPDAFSATGQLWGSPVYDWDALRADGYGWWLRRLDAALSMFDVVRIDHFRAFASYWRVPAGETTATNGEWMTGPGMDFIGVVKSWFNDPQLIAEDLGLITQDVYNLLAASGLPGMRVLQFAFADEQSSHLPHWYERSCIAYTGTHDNNTAAGWLADAPRSEVRRATEYLGLNEREGTTRGFIRGAMSSVAQLCITQMQDWLELPSSARMNTPATVGSNWKWRMKSGAANRTLAEKILEMTRRCGR